MKNAHILCAVVWVLGLMTACKYGTDNNNTTDTLQPVVFPKNAPNIKYLQIFDSLDSFGWFENHALSLQNRNHYVSSCLNRTRMFKYSKT